MIVLAHAFTQSWDSAAGSILARTMSARSELLSEAKVWSIYNYVIMNMYGV